MEAYNRNDEALIVNNVTLHYETIEDIILLDKTDNDIREVLDVSIENENYKDYIIKTTIPGDDELITGYRLKTMLVLTYHIEYTEDSELAQTKVLTRNKLVNLTITLPKNYVQGANINITPSIVDISSKVINCRKIYLSTYLKMTITL